MAVELPGERLDQRGTLGLHLAAGQAGQHLRVALAGDQRLEHAADREGVHGAGHGRDFDQRVFQQLLQPLPVPGAVAGQVGAQPGVIAQLPDLGRGHEGRPQHAPLGQLRQPHRVQLVGFRAARGVLHVVGVDQLHRQAGRFQQVEERAPVVAGRLDRDLLDPLGRQLPAQLNERVGGRVHLLHPGAPPARPGRMRHPRAHHPRRLRHIHRGDPLNELLVLLVLDLLRLPHARHLLTSKGQTAGCPGASVGNRNSDRRARSTVRDPSRSRPRRQTLIRPQVPACSRRWRAPTPIFAPARRPHRDTRTLMGLAAAMHHQAGQLGFRP
jgi:hypothetical protein